MKQPGKADGGVGQRGRQSPGEGEGVSGGVGARKGAVGGARKGETQ